MILILRILLIIAIVFLKNKKIKVNFEFLQLLEE